MGYTVLIGSSQKVLTLLCMAVVGELVLNNGSRVISAEYIDDMLGPHLKLGERFGFMNYGYESPLELCRYL